MEKEKIENLNKLIEFVKEIEKLKLVERRVLVSNKKRFENSAEHSWHIAMFIMVFEEYLPENVNILKMYKMALIHDLVEIYAGDTFFFDKKGRKTKKKREEKAARKLFNTLPEKLKKNFFKLFEEYEEENTKESKLVRSFDQLQPMVQNIISDAYGWKLHKITPEDIENHKREYMNHNKIIMTIYNKLLDEAKRKKLL